MKIKDVVQVLEDNHGFKTGVRSLKIRLDQWGFNKNLTNAAMKSLIAKQDLRKSHGKDTTFVHHGAPIHSARLETFGKRHARGNDSDPSHDAPTPEGIEYFTPRSFDPEESEEDEQTSGVIMSRVVAPPITAQEQRRDPTSEALSRLYALFENENEPLCIQKQSVLRDLREILLHCSRTMVFPQHVHKNDPAISAESTARNREAGFRNKS
ncbi:hypothetical protein Micbo1qcDRAFT_201481 [Microdochium bolleyi]|uniref:Clr5 domain-containing protein n=1 Tax=Microdochium bolleyi TaxID=196109 RepID=A0A136JG99_9PEZI|nr:hypothetical protein Micbo1qcDRAFT_201481 [Microdochium bolleyi]